MIYSLFLTRNCLSCYLTYTYVCENGTNVFVYKYGKLNESGSISDLVVHLSLDFWVLFLSRIFLVIQSKELRLFSTVNIVEMKALPVLNYDNFEAHCPVLIKFEMPMESGTKSHVDGDKWAAFGIYLTVMSPGIDVLENAF